MKITLENAITLLCENFDAWDGEEESVKEEHADLIERTEAFIDAYKETPVPARYDEAVPTRNFVEGDWSFRIGVRRRRGGEDIAFAVYPKGERSHWSLAGRIAQSGDCWITEFGYTEAFRSFGEAKAHALKCLAERKR